MSARDDGGPVYARPASDGGLWPPQPGMSLRDHFAGLAGDPPGYFMRNEDEFDEAGAAKYHARWAYAKADAMLAKRKRTGDAS